MNHKEYSPKKLRVIRFGGVIFFIGSFISALLYTGNDKFLKDCVANGNSVKYCNNIYDERNLAFQKKKDSIVTKIDLKSKNLFFSGETYINGESYFGQFLDDKRHGFGTLIEVNGNKYIGQWVEGEMTGQGTYVWGPKSKKSGDKYIGQWKKSKITGFGKLTSANGEIYIGEFFKNKKHGQGISISPTQEKEFGTWRYGKKIKNR